MSQEKSKTMLMQIFLGGGGGGGWGVKEVYFLRGVGGVKEVYYGICASSE